MLLPFTRSAAMDDQMKRLWDRYRLHGDEAARNELILANLPLVRFVLGRLPISPPPGLSHEDLLGVGVIALLRAIEAFDPARGNAFTTFGVPRIRGAILDELRAHDILPRTVRERAAVIERVTAEARNEGRPAPSIEELAASTGLSADQVQETMSALSLRSLLSLEAACHTAPGGREERILEAAADRQTATPLGALLTKERDRLLAQAIAELPEPERRIVVLYYRHGLMLSEIAKVLGVTKSRISQLHSRALFRLRARLAPGTPPAPAATARITPQCPRAESQRPTYALQDP
jgi:RNA polymerase sigma factor for flagellar operon FliA